MSGLFFWKILMNKNQIAFFMQQAIAEGKKGMQLNEGGPFGALIVKDMNIVGLGHNMVTSSYDPTAHAEIMAIRTACQNLRTFSLKGCLLFTSCEPCPMCLSAMYWARLDAYYYASTKEDAQKAGFDDSVFYDELRKDTTKRSLPSYQVLRPEALTLFDLWKQNAQKILY